MSVNTVILIGKSANKLNSIKVYNNVSLSSTAVEKDITVGAGEIFEAFIFENGTLVPVLDTKILYAE